MRKHSQEITRDFYPLLAVVERITPPIRIDELRLYRRQGYPQALWLSLTVAQMRRENADQIPTEIEIPAPSPLRIERDPFAYGLNEITAPQPAEDKSDGVSEMPLPKLTGILWSETPPIAIFTSHHLRPQFVRVGEVIANASVIEIQP